METVRGDVTILRFRGDSRVRAEFAGRSVQGRWRLENRNLCFYWTGAPRECWPWARPLARGETRQLTSDRGNRIRIRRI